jgi:hypothetical protein
MLQTWPVSDNETAGKGIVLIFSAYSWGGDVSSLSLVYGPYPGLSGGAAAGYLQEKWIATARLGFAFPSLVFTLGFLTSGL